MSHPNVPAKIGRNGAHVATFDGLMKARFTASRFLKENLPIF